MYMNELIERMNNINWDEVGRNSSKLDPYFGYEYLRRLAKFFKDESIMPIKPVMANIARLLGDVEEEVVISDYLNPKAVKFIGEGMSKNIIKYYLQLARYADKNSNVGKYLSIYDPLIKLLERGGKYVLSINELEIVNISCYPLRGWYEDFVVKEPINIDEL
ncbi:hypothetical protein NNC19_09590 [Clostridium sp. SHJSY1]|nr:hypothetical protein [Clostridium sp. SHJSY1]